MIIRADCDPMSQPVCWTPAHDFRSVFKFEDRREDGWGGVADVWERAERMSITLPGNMGRASLSTGVL